MAVDARSFPRGSTVVCRTARGLEVGDVVAPVAVPLGHRQGDGSLLRNLTPTDELWLTRLHKHRHEAIAECERRLRQADCADVLVDVEPLFDGQTIYFYFLRPPTRVAEELIQTLAETYESQARIREFTDAVEAGCGPGCGTEEASGCGSGGCTTCSLASTCRSA